MATHERNGHLIGYEVFGDGSIPVLGFHGTTQARNAWDQVRAEMGDDFQWVVCEFPGSGESSMPSAPLEVDDLAADGIAVMESLGHRAFHVAGYSLGAVVALHTAAILKGADVIRVHDVKEAVQAARVTDRLRGL